MWEIQQQRARVRVHQQLSGERAAAASNSSLAAATAALALSFTGAWHMRQHLNASLFSAYLLILGCRGDDVVHQHGHQLGHSMHARGGCPVLRGKTNGLSLGLGLVHPFARYRVYDVEYPQFVCARSFLEVREEFLDENGFGLRKHAVSNCLRPQLQMACCQDDAPYLNVGDT